MLEYMREIWEGGLESSEENRREILVEEKAKEGENSNERQTRRRRWEDRRDREGESVC